MVWVYLIRGLALCALPDSAQPGDAPAESAGLVRVAVAGAAILAAVACAVPADRAARQRRPHHRPACVRVFVSCICCVGLTFTTIYEPHALLTL